MVGGGLVAKLGLGVVPFRAQGRVFGFAQSVELAASPIPAFMIGPIAEFWLIPFVAVLVALASAPYRRLSGAYAAAPAQQLESAATSD